MRKRSILAMILVFAAVSPALVSAQSLSAQMTGFSGGAADGSGLAVLSISGTTISTTILTNGLSGPAGAHIHKVSDGSVFIDLGVSFTGGSGSGSVTADAAKVAAVVASPSAYWVMVHSSDFPNGAIKGVIGSATGSGGSTELYFPVEAAIAGQGGTQWKSDIRLVNRSGSTATVRLEYYAEGGAGNAGPTAVAGPFPVNAGSVLVLDDAVNSELGISNGKGGLGVVSDQPIDGTSRVYNDRRSDGAGTLGQQVPAMEIDEALSSGMVPMLSNVPKGSGRGFRGALGWFNPGDAPVDLEISFFAADGAFLGSASATIGGHGLVQKRADQLLAALADVPEFYATFTAAAPLFVYGTVVDNVSGDSIYIPAVK
ncbi:MAG: CHRD domain-containing protein [Acidobacteria bacterium]|nr:CHRD domain-containing protein [Acidobacteriota bacterium]